MRLDYVWLARGDLGEQWILIRMSRGLLVIDRLTLLLLMFGLTAVNLYYVSLHTLFV